MLSAGDLDERLREDIELEDDEADDIVLPPPCNSVQHHHRRRSYDNHRQQYSHASSGAHPRNPGSNAGGSRHGSSRDLSGMDPLRPNSAASAPLNSSLLPPLSQQPTLQQNATGGSGLGGGIFGRRRSSAHARTTSRMAGFQTPEDAQAQAEAMARNRLEHEAPIRGLAKQMSRMDMLSKSRKTVAQTSGNHRSIDSSSLPHVGAWLSSHSRNPSRADAVPAPPPPPPGSNPGNPDGFLVGMEAGNLAASLHTPVLPVAEGVAVGVTGQTPDTPPPSRGLQRRGSLVNADVPEETEDIEHELMIGEIKSISMSDEAAIVRKALVVIALSVIAAILLRVFAGRVDEEVNVILVVCFVAVMLLSFPVIRFTARLFAYIITTRASGLLYRGNRYYFLVALHYDIAITLWSIAATSIWRHLFKDWVYDHKGLIHYGDVILQSHLALRTGILVKNFLVLLVATSYLWRPYLRRVQSSILAQYILLLLTDYCIKGYCNSDDQKFAIEMERQGIQDKKNLSLYAVSKAMGFIPRNKLGHSFFRQLGGSDTLDSSRDATLLGHFLFDKLLELSQPPRVRTPPPPPRRSLGIAALTGGGAAGEAYRNTVGGRFTASPDRRMPRWGIQKRHSEPTAAGFHSAPNSPLRSSGSLSTSGEAANGSGRPASRIFGNRGSTSGVGGARQKVANKAADKMANGIIKLKHAGERAFGSSTGAGSGIIVGEGFGGEAGLGGPGGGGSARFRQAGGGGLGGSEDEGDSRRGASKHMPMLMEESMKGGGRPVSAGMGDVAAAAAAALAIESGRDGFAALEGDEEENYGGPEEPKDSRGHKKPTGSKEAMGDHEARDGKGGAVFDSGQTTVTSPSTDGGQAEARTAGSNSSTNKDDRRSSEMSTDDVAGGGGSDHGDDCRGNDDDDDDNEEEKVKPVLTRKTLCPALEAELMHVAFKIFDLDNSGTVTKEEMAAGVVGTFKDHRSLALTLQDSEHIARKLGLIIMGVILFILMFVWLSIWGADVVSLSVTFASFLIAFSFMIGTAASNLTSSVLFIFVSRLYDVGDRIHIYNDGQTTSKPTDVTVVKVDLMTTVFKRWDEQVFYMPNHLLASKTIVNIQRTAHQWHEFYIQISSKTPGQKVKALQAALQAFSKSKDKPEGLYTRMGFALVGIEDSTKLSIRITFRQRNNWQHMEKKWACQSMCTWAIKNACETLGISYTLPEVPLQIKQKRV